MPALKLPKWQIKIIVEMYSLANKHGTVGDVACLVDLMACACPGIPEVIAAQARIIMCQRNYIGARELLVKNEALYPNNAVIKALLAFCLFNLRDTIWEAYAEEALALPFDDIAQAIIETIASISNKPLRGLHARAGTSSESFVMPMMGLAC